MIYLYIILPFIIFNIWQIKLYSVLSYIYIYIYIKYIYIYMTYICQYDSHSQYPIYYDYSILLNKIVTVKITLIECVITIV